tara:strand:+ start:46 stop:153 length:108 start_codon:yes stop_codon:yes gene_type:complete
MRKVLWIVGLGLLKFNNFNADDGYFLSKEDLWKKT